MHSEILQEFHCQRQRLLCTVGKIARGEGTHFSPPKIEAEACCAATQACLHNARKKLASKMTSMMSTTRNKDEKLHDHPVHRTLEG